MEKETYLFQVKRVFYKAIEELRNLIHEQGVESNYTHEKCLRIKDATYSFELGEGRHLCEIGHDQLIDDCGYIYSLYVLDTEDLLNVIDHLIKVYSK